MEQDQRELLSEFNAQNVRFLVVGGYAYSYYTEPRATKDLDLGSLNRRKRTQPASSLL